MTSEKVLWKVCLFAYATGMCSWAESGTVSGFMVRLVCGFAGVPDGTGSYLNLFGTCVAHVIPVVLPPWSSQGVLLD